MGYTGLKDWTNSDMAAGLYDDAIQKLLNALNKGAKLKDNSFNTSGPENVAMIIEGGLLDSIPESYIQDYFNYDIVVKGLLKSIKDSDASNKRKWNCEVNRIWHNQSYKRMLRSVKKFLKKKQIEID